MKIKLNRALMDLADKPIMIDGKEFTVGIALANVLISSKEGGKMKLYALARKFYGDKSAELDEADLALTKKAVSDSDLYTALILGQLGLILEESGDK